MTRRSTPRLPWRTVLPALLLALFPALAHAQGGTVRGTVAGEEGAAVAGAQVSVTGTRLSATTNAQGAFTLANVPAGTHPLRVSQAGYRTRTEEVTVRAGEEALVAIALTPNPVELDGLVVSASRRAERVTQAPATITRIGAQVLENAQGGSFAGALKQVKGLDFIQTGATTVAINARGFNSSFNNRMLMMEDGRIAVLPENGLPVGQFTATPKIDLAGVEVIVGPGAALYGADASNGVLTLQTKDPRDYPGTTVEVTGGNREYKDVQVRHAGVFGDWGYKVAGEFQDANDWSNQLTYGGGRIKETAVGGEVDWTSRVARASGALVRYMGESRLEFSGGMSETDGVGQTNVGRNQLVDWRYNFAQARLTTPNWYLNAYRTQSQAGKTYAINRFSEFKAAPANAGKSDEELRRMSDWPSNGQIYAAELQNNFRLPALLNTKVIWGGQFRHDRVSSDRQWLTDRLTGEDLAINQLGLYAQAETPLLPQVNLLLAGRYDNHENYDPQWSPKAGLVFKPAESQTLRVTYNRAFKAPTTLQTSFYIPDFVPRVGVFGNTQGTEVRKADGTVLATYDALVPEENQTWEVGYKGVFKGRLFLDVTGYRSEYEDFLSPLTLINFPALGTFAYQNGKKVTNEQGVDQATLIYFNLGKAELRGADLGVNYVLNPKVDFSGTFSWTDLHSMEGIDIRTITGARDTARIRELSTLNSPEKKWSLGANFRDLHEWTGGVTVRHVDEYFFASGINKGTIPTFTTLDANVGYRLRKLNTTLTLGVSNLFTCRNANPLDKADSDKCGFGEEHFEMVNMPSIGTMIFIGGRYQTK
jgi:outer membrane receptor for ferrienterochelin and colicins